MHIFTIEDLQNALDIARKPQDEEKNQANEEWRNIFVEILKTFELGCKDFETGHAQNENADDGIGEYQSTMTEYLALSTFACEQAVLCYQSGEYQKAIDLSREALAFAKEAGNKQGEGDAFAVLGLVYNEIGEFKMAIGCYQISLDLFEELGGKGHIYRNMGNAFDNIGEYQRAIDCHRKHLEIAEELGDKGGIGTAHGNMGNAYNNLGKHLKAIDCHRTHLEIAEELGDKAEIGRAHGNLGNAYNNNDEYQKAIDCHRKFLEIAEELDDKVEIGIAHGNMGLACQGISEYQKAIDCHSKCFEIFEELGNKKGIAIAHANMGNAYNSIGKYIKALDCHRKHLEIAEELGEKARIGLAHGNMGNAYNSIGEYQKAIDCFRKHLEIAEELDHKVLIGGAHVNMGMSYQKIGEYQKANDCHSKCFKIFEELGSKKGIAVAHGNMGNAYSNLGEYQKAIDCHRKYLEISEELGDKGGIGIAHGNIGDAYNNIGEYQKAIDYHRKALEIAEELGDIRAVARTQSNLGLSYQMNNNDRLACSFSAKSILSYQKIRRFGVYEDGLNTSISNVFSEVHKIFLKSLLNLKQVKSALLVSDSGKAKALYDLTRRCVDVVTDPALDENFTLAIEALANDPCLKTNEAFFDIVLSKVIYLMRDENIVSYTFDHQHNLHAWVISRKGVFHKTWKTANGISTKTYGESINRGIQECFVRNLPKHVSHMSEQAEGYSLGGNAKKNHLDLPFIGNKDDRGDKFTRDLEERVRNLTRIDKPTSEAINCDPNISVLKSLKGRYNLDASTTNQLGFHNSSQESSEENEKDKKKVVGRYSLESSNVTHGRVKNSSDHRATHLEKDSLQMKLEKLYSIYISPIEEYLVGSKILVVPEGSQFKVPFCALLNSKKERLCDRYSLQFTPALHVLNASLSKPLAKIGQAFFVGSPIVGDVKFGDEVISVSQLANAKVEAEECSKYFNAKPLLEEKATKENVLKSLKDASVIHIAAHGDMDHADIFLAPNEGAPKPPSEEHYLLTAEDVVECTLKARLVVLSCCHSGRGQISAEGVVGIARSFLGAGARSVLVSLWYIPDRATMEFMKLFYENVIEGVSVCVALQQTMIEMKKKYEMAAWSYFQIVGEDISLSKDEVEEIRRQSSAR